MTSLHASGFTVLPATISAARAASVVAAVARLIAELTADLVQSNEIFYFTERDERLSAARAIGYAMVLRDGALRSDDGDLRAAGAFLAQVMDELARVLTDQYPQITGESTDDILRAVAGSYGHRLD